MREKIVLLMTSIPTELAKLAEDHPDEVSIGERKRLTGTEAEFIAIITLSGVFVRSLSEVLVALIKKEERIEITYKGETIKSSNLDAVKKILRELDDVESS